MSELVWITCPQDPVADPADPARQTVTLRVLVVPRLDDSLERSGMADWPHRLRECTPLVEVRGAGRVPASRVVVADSAVWHEFFDHLPVTPWRQPQPYQPPDVDPTGAHVAAIDSTYRRTAAMISDLGDPSAPQVAATARAAVTGTWLTESPPRPVGTTRPWRAPDFHRAVALLREHHEVLRALGLIFEMTVAAGDLPHAAAPTGPEFRPTAFVRVTCRDGLEPLRVSAPWTGYEYDGRRFRPASTGDISAGMVNLRARTDGPDGPVRRWEVATVDVDNGVDRLRDTARVLADNPDAPAALPALRSGGLSLLRTDRRAAFARRRDAALANAGRGSLDEAELTADDLVLGYRVDIQPDAGDTWLSLCRRAASYHVNGRAIVTGDEEGHIKPYAAGRAPDDPARPQQRGLLPTDQVVARWTGWSHAVPPPGFGLVPASGARRNDAVPLPYDLTWDHKVVPGSLPRLRFGSRYRIRVRVADLTGRGVPPDDLDDDYASDSVLYTRWEPIPPPEVPAPPGALAPDGKPVPGALGPGGATDVLVVRTDPEGDEPLPSYPPNRERLLLPPPTSRALAEQHGELSGADEQTWRRAHQAMTPAAARAEDAGRYQWLPDPAAAGVTFHLPTAPGQDDEPITEDHAWSPSGTDPTAKRLRLVPGELGSRVRLERAGDLAQVHLPPAAEVALEVSSFPHSGDLSDFTIWRFVQDGTSLDHAPAAALAMGRHPMLTPPRTIRLVHAVRRPLRPPTGSLRPERRPGQTFVLLSPPPQAPLLGIDRASTGQLELSASWTPSIDDPQRPIDVDPPEVREPVQLVPITRDLAALPPLRHDFGDTRHRTVRYTATAVSRFRQYFGEAEPDAFTTATDMQVEVLSTACPAAAVVLAVVPGFHWECPEPGPGWSRLERTRHGGRLRVELARPWFDSGSGEQLAVVANLEYLGGGYSPKLAPYLSWVHRDPIHLTPEPRRSVLTPSEFLAAPAAHERIRLVEGEHEVTPVPFPVEPAGDRWYADVLLPGPAAHSYNPLVSLALARYQPHSLPGLELSAVVRAEQAPLLPDRTLILERSGDRIVVTLQGLGPHERPNRVAVALERCRDGVNPTTASLTQLSTGDTGVPIWRREGVWWTDLNTPTVGLLARPGDRLVVREFERLPRDSGSAPPREHEDVGDRVVFLDVVPIPA